MSTNPLGSLYGPIYGPFYFSVVVSTAFYGLTCMQTFFYHVHYRNDPLRMKIFVTALWIFNTAHEALNIAGVYKYLMAGLQNPISVLEGPPELIILLTCLVAIITQGYFVYRIYLFTDRNIVAPSIWILLALLQSASTVVYVCKALYIADGLQAVKLTALRSNPFMTLATVSLALAAGVDVLVAIFLTFLLVRKRIATSYSSTIHVLQRLTLFAVNTGIWTALFALLSIVMLHVFPLTTIYIVFVDSLCPVYCNTLLANLNARGYVRGGPGTHNTSVDLFTSATPPISTVTKINKHHRESNLSNLVTSNSAHLDSVWKTTDVTKAIRATRGESV